VAESLSAQAGEAPGKVGAQLGALASRAILPLALVLMFLGFGWVQPNVFGWDNLSNIMIQVSYLAIFATAQMFVLITRGFDLSVGTAVSMISVLSGIVMADVAKAHPDMLGAAVALGIVVGLGAGLIVGLVNGLIVAVLRVNPFVVTLGTLNICLGFATTMSGGFQIFNLPAPLRQTFYTDHWLGLPAPVAMAIIVLAVSHFVLNHLVLGRSLYLLGSNPRAAHVAGLPSRLYLALAYVICSGIMAVGALLLTARTGSGEPNMGGSLTLESIAAAVVGGVSLRGGEGTVVSPVLGALLVTVLSNGMNLLRIDGYFQQIILGVVIIAAIFLDRLRRTSI
jgi:ribose transport system permease protein